METSFDSIYATDEDLVQKGAPMPIGLLANGKEMVLYVAQEGNEEHVKAIRKREKQLEQMRHNPEGLYKIRCAIVAESILRGWENILDKDGKDYPATVENKAAVLEKYKSLMSDIITFASDRSNYKPQDAPEDPEKDTEGN